MLQHLVRNAYIIVAKDGTPLMTSGKKAFDLLSKHLLDVIALNKFGDFVLFVGKVFVVLITAFVGYSVVIVSSLNESLTLFPLMLTSHFRKTPKSLILPFPLSLELSSPTSLLTASSQSSR